MTGTSHQDSLSGAKISGSVSTWITVVAVAGLGHLDRVGELGGGDHPDDVGAEAGGVGGQVDGQLVAVEAAGRRRGSGSDVPNRCEPSASDSAPMEAKPWFCTSTTMTLTPSCTAVTSSVAIIR